MQEYLKFVSNISLFLSLKVVIDILRKGNSVGDWGTYASNAIISGNFFWQVKVLLNYSIQYKYNNTESKGINVHVD